MAPPCGFAFLFCSLKRFFQAWSFEPIADIEVFREAIPCGLIDEGNLQFLVQLQHRIGVSLVEQRQFIAGLGAARMLDLGGCDARNRFEDQLVLIQVEFLFGVFAVDHA